MTTTCNKINLSVRPFSRVATLSILRRICLLANILLKLFGLLTRDILLFLVITLLSSLQEGKTHPLGVYPNVSTGSEKYMPKFGPKYRLRNSRKTSALNISKNYLNISPKEFLTVSIYLENSKQVKCELFKSQPLQTNLRWR